MQLDPVSTTTAHFGNNLTNLDLIAFLDQQTAIVRIGAQIGFVVLDDDHVAISNQATASINHGPVGCCSHRLTQLPGNINPFIQTAV